MDFLKQLQAGIGQAYMPNYGSLDPAAQQAASNQAMLNLGAGMLANSRARPMEAFGQSLQGLQRQGIQNMQGQLMADQMAEQKDERERRERRRKGMAQWFSNPQVMSSMAISPELQPYFRNLAENDPEMIPGILSSLNRGPGEFTALSPEQVKAAGLPEGAVVYRGAEGWNVKMPDAGQRIEVNTGNQSTLESELVKELGTRTGKVWAGISDQGVKAGAMNRDMELLDELIKVAPQGPIEGRLAEMFPGFSSAGAAFESVVKRLAPQQRAEGSGSTSDIEYEGMLKALPALRNNPNANALISASVKRKAQIDQAMAAEVNKFSAGQQDFTTTQQNLQRLSQMSIMTPELQSLIRGVGPQGSDDILNQADAIVGG